MSPRHQVVATAGHVDHGKSTLVRALTGMEPDRLAEERRRGMTLDLGFAWTRLPGGADLAFVDVPGHERFVTTMLAGAGPVPAVLFVVAADDGWSAQSTEHLAALDALGVRHGLLAVTRADLASPRDALAEARDRLAGTTLAGVPAVAVSAVTGAGLDELRDALGELVQRLPPADPSARLRLWVDRSFSRRGAGTVVTGTLGAGRLAVGDVVTVSRTGVSARVRALQSAGRPMEVVEGVTRVAVNLRGLEVADVSRGDALVREHEWVVTAEADVRLTRRGIVAPAPHEPRAAAHWMLHVGSAAVPARLRPFPAPAGELLGRLRLAGPLPLSIGDRALLRDPSRHDVMLGVEVLDPDPPPLRRRGSAAARAAALARVDAADALAELDRRGPTTRAHLRRLGVDAEQLVPLAGDWCVTEEQARRLRGRVRDAVAEYARRHPLRPEPSVGEIAATLGLPDPVLVPALLDPPLRVREGRVEDPARDRSLPAQVSHAVAEVRAHLGRSPFVSPEADRLRSLGLGPAELASAERLGLLLRVAPDVVLLPDAPQRAVERLATLPPPFTAAEARTALESTRRTTVPLLELLDRRGLTRRHADGTRSVRDARTETAHAGAPRHGAGPPTG